VNPFRILVIIAAVIAIILFAGFIAVHFFGAIYRPQSLGELTSALRAL
jgi:hypothetical protein